YYVLFAMLTNLNSFLFSVFPYAFVENYQSMVHTLFNVFSVKALTLVNAPPRAAIQWAKAPYALPEIDFRKL
ncbi:8413_t:CDS:2, partial [Paraglomus occultum]